MKKITSLMLGLALTTQSAFGIENAESCLDRQIERTLAERCQTGDEKCLKIVNTLLLLTADVAAGGVVSAATRNLLSRMTIMSSGESLKVARTNMANLLRVSLGDFGFKPFTLPGGMVTITGENATQRLIRAGQVANAGYEQVLRLADMLENGSGNISRMSAISSDIQASVIQVKNLTQGLEGGGIKYDLDRLLRGAHSAGITTRASTSFQSHITHLSSLQRRINRVAGGAGVATVLGLVVLQGYLLTDIPDAPERAVDELNTNANVNCGENTEIQEAIEELK